MADIVLLADERISAVPVRECHEPLVDVREAAEIEVDGRQADPDGDYARVRLGVLRRLRRAQSCLPQGYRLVVVEGYRPPELQESYFAERVAFLREQHPDWPAARAHREASRYISPPEVAPHTTGGAVDLTLRGPDGRLCWMGTEVNATPEDSQEACYTDAANISHEAAANRARLRAAMARAGFVNYPTEWWHWSTGDRYWAFTAGEALAHYGPLRAD
ncbi:dipeptidase [Nonomuraea sp. NN258]|nr:dipeptidase [Nonomuraea antri]